MAALQLALALPAAELYSHFAVPRLSSLYAPLLDLVWLALLGAGAVAVLPTRRQSLV